MTNSDPYSVQSARGPLALPSLSRAPVESPVNYLGPPYGEATTLPTTELLAVLRQEISESQVLQNDSEAFEEQRSNDETMFVSWMHSVLTGWKEQMQVVGQIGAVGDEALSLLNAQRSLFQSTKQVDGELQFLHAERQNIGPKVSAANEAKKARRNELDSLRAAVKDDETQRDEAMYYTDSLNVSRAERVLGEAERTLSTLAVEQADLLDRMQVTLGVTNEQRITCMELSARSDILRRQFDALKERYSTIRQSFTNTSLDDFANDPEQWKPSGHRTLAELIHDIGELSLGESAAAKGRHAHLPQESKPAKPSLSLLPRT